MGMGNYREGNLKKVFDKTYYSRLRFKNPDTKLVLGFNFSSGMLVIKMSQADDNNQYTDLESCYLTGLKARIFLNEYNRFKEDFDAKKVKEGAAYGVTTGMSETVTIMSFCVVDGSKAVAIGKVDGSGKVKEMHKFKFNDNFHYGLEWKDLDNMVVSKKFYPDIEFDAFGDILKEFISCYGGAQAYIAADLGKYDYRHTDNNINEIMKKLGIQVPSSVSSNYGKSRGFFDNGTDNSSQSRTTSTSTSIDDIEDSLEGDD